MKSFFLSLLIAAPTLMVASGKIEVDTIQKRDRPFVITHDSGESIQAIYVDAGGDWAYLPDDHFIRQDTATYMAAPVGEYLITTGDAKIVKVIDEGGPRPDPKPKPDPPDPKPDPDPDPKPEPSPDLLMAKWIVIIEEVMDRSKFPQEATVIRDADFRDFVSELGLDIRVYDPDQGTAATYKEAMAKRGVTAPCMFIMESATKFKLVPMPKSVAEAESVIRGSIIR